MMEPIKEKPALGFVMALARLIVGRCGLRADPDNRVQTGCLDFTITLASHKCFLTVRNPGNAFLGAQDIDMNSC